MKRIYVLLVLAVTLCGQTLVNPNTAPDIAGDGKVHQIAAGGGALWITVCALRNNATAVRLGDSKITTERGIPLEAGACYGLNPPSSPNHRHSLGGWYYLVQKGDKLSITYGQ